MTSNQSKFEDSRTNHLAVIDQTPLDQQQTDLPTDSDLPTFAKQYTPTFFKILQMNTLQYVISDFSEKCICFLARFSVIYDFGEKMHFHILSRK